MSSIFFPAGAGRDHAMILYTSHQLLPLHGYPIKLQLCQSYKKKRTLRKMPRPNKRDRPIPSDYKKGIANVTEKAKKKAISLLDRCLEPHCLSSVDRHGLVVDVSKTLELLDSSSDESEADETVVVESKKPLKLVKSRHSVDDDHNEVCEVCEKGGDLLCCDTCSLVFHLSCIRPKLNSIPKGKWSCAHCVADNLGVGDAASAKKALIKMSRLSRGLDSEDEDDGNGGRLSRVGEITVARSGKRIIVRKTAHSQIMELGRYDTLEGALSSLKSLYSRPSAAASPASPNDGGGSASKRGRSNSTVSLNEDEDLWCIYCMDDASVQFCAFCGCRTCFGKHDSDYLLVCDHCDQESHTYCLSPQLTQVPVDSWYCPACVATGIDKAAALAAASDEQNTVDSENQSIGTDSETNEKGNYKKSGSKSRTSLSSSSSLDGRAESSVSTSRPPLSARPVGRPPVTARPVGRPPNRGPGRPTGQGRPPSSQSNTSTTVKATTTHVAESIDPEPVASLHHMGMGIADHLTLLGKAGARGRGRPPGSGRRSKDVVVEAAAAAAAASVLASSSLALTAMALPPPLARGKSSSSSSDSTASAATASAAAAASSLLPAAASVLGLPVAQQPSEALGVGIESALAMIEKAAANRPFTTIEKSLLEQVREWAPLKDLEAIHKALVQQKEILISRILAVESEFSVDQLVIYKEDEELKVEKQSSFFAVATADSSSSSSSYVVGGGADHASLSVKKTVRRSQVSRRSSKTGGRKKDSMKRPRQRKQRAVVTTTGSRNSLLSDAASSAASPPLLHAVVGPGHSLDSFDMGGYDVGLDLFLPTGTATGPSPGILGGDGDDDQEEDDTSKATGDVVVEGEEEEEEDDASGAADGDDDQDGDDEKGAGEKVETLVKKQDAALNKTKSASEAGGDSVMVEGGYSENNIDDGTADQGTATAAVAIATVCGALL